MKIDAVFSGGGVKAFAIIGALQSFEKQGYSIERVGGTSAGAIIASLVAADYTVDQIKAMFQSLDLLTFLDEPLLVKYFSPLKLFALYFKKGLYKGDEFEKWLTVQLKRKGIETFSDLRDGYLKVVASDITKGRLIVIPDDLERLYHVDRNTFKVATAVRMSAGFPYFFIPKQMKNNDSEISYIVDGGLLSNFPLWLFQRNRQYLRPTIGVTLSEDIEHQEPETIRNGLDMLQAIFKTMLKAHDTRYIATDDAQHVIFIPVKHVKTVDLTIDDTVKQTLIQLGEERTEKFLKSWSH